MQVRRGADLQSSEGETEVSAPKFRKVEPLQFLGDDDPIAADVASHLLWINMHGWTLDQARALRDWLNKALPEEKP